MKLPLVATRLGIISVKILVLIIIALSILPFLTGNITVDFDTDGDTDWTYDDGVVRMTSPFTVDNQGFFDINDMVVEFALRDGNGDLIMDGQSVPMSAPAGRETDLQLQIEFDLNDLPSDMMCDMVFNGTELEFMVGFSARYTLDLVQAGAEIVSDMEWDAMLSQMEIDEMAAYPGYDGMDYYMQIPYSFQARGMVEGEPILLTIVFSDSFGYEEEVVTVVEASGYFNGYERVPIPQETYERLMTQGEQLSASFTLGFMDCSNTVEESWWWSP